VAVSEAVGLASQLSTDDSPKFVNGVLRTVVETKAPPEATTAEATPTAEIA
jgi:transcription termination factor NusB